MNAIHAYVHAFECRRCFTGPCGKCENGYNLAHAGSPATIIFMAERYPATVVSTTASTIVVAWDVRRGHLSVPNTVRGKKLTFVRRNGTWRTKGYTLYVGEREYKSTVTT